MVTETCDDDETEPSNAPLTETAQGTRQILTGEGPAEHSLASHGWVNSEFDEKKAKKSMLWSSFIRFVFSFSLPSLLFTSFCCVFLPSPSLLLILLLFRSFTCIWGASHT